MNKHKKSVDVNFVPNIAKAPKSYSKWMTDNMHKEASITLRRETRQAMHRHIIMNECDSVQGILNKSIQHNYMEFPRLVSRPEDLERLYHESFHPGIHRGKHAFHNYNKNIIKI